MTVVFEMNKICVRCLSQVLSLLYSLCLKLKADNKLIDLLGLLELIVSDELIGSRMNATSNH